MTTDRKEALQYITAIGFLITGIVLCYISFFLNEYDINNGVLFYLGQAVIFCGAVFGINVMVKNQVFEAETRIKKEIDKELKHIEGDD